MKTQKEKTDLTKFIELEDNFRGLEDTLTQMYMDYNQSSLNDYPLEERQKTTFHFSLIRELIRAAEKEQAFLKVV